MALCPKGTMVATVQNSDLADTTSRILAITVTACDVYNDRVLKLELKSNSDQRRCNKRKEKAY